MRKSKTQWFVNFLDPFFPLHEHLKNKERLLGFYWMNDV